MDGYIDRWLKEHPQIRIYLKKDEYEWLTNEADKRGVLMKEVILEAIRNAKEVKSFYRKEYMEGYRKGRREGYKLSRKKAYINGFKEGNNVPYGLFIDEPKTFYNKLMMIRVKERG